MREDSAGGFTVDALPPPPKKLPNQDPMPPPPGAAGLGAAVALPPPPGAAGLGAAVTLPPPPGATSPCGGVEAGAGALAPASSLGAVLDEGVDTSGICEISKLNGVFMGLAALALATGCVL